MHVRRSHARVWRTVNNAVVGPFQVLLATCTDGMRGLRDRAFLLSWSGGRRRPEVVGLQVDDVCRLGP